MDVIRVSKNYLRIFNRIIEFSLIPVGIYLINNPVNYGIFFLFGLIQLTRWMDKRYGWNFEEVYFSFMVFSIYLGIFGDNFFKFYYYTTYYDKILHFFIPMGLTYIIARRVSPKSLSIFIMMGFSGLFELVEFYGDLFLGTTTQGVFSQNLGVILSPVRDTMYDMTTALFGSIAGFFLNLLRK